MSDSSINAGQWGFVRWALWIIFGVSVPIAWYYRYGDLAYFLSLAWVIGLFYQLNLIMQAKVPSKVQKYILGVVIVIIFLSVSLITLNLARKV